MCVSDNLRIPPVNLLSQPFTLEFIINDSQPWKIWLKCVTMLEHQQLLISTSIPGSVLLFQSPENLKPLGNATLKSTLLSQNWTVREEDDNPLVFTLNKLNVPFANWTISDASDLTVGFLYSNQLLMPTGGIYCFRTVLNSGVTAWVDEVGIQLASHQPQSPTANILVFNESQRNLPFGRMLILADYLIQYASKQLR